MKHYSEYISDTISFRRSLKDKDFCKFGINYLDDSLLKLDASDFIYIHCNIRTVLRALMMQIVKYNSSNNRDVACFLFEMSKRDFILQQLWREIVEVTEGEGKKVPASRQIQGVYRDTARRRDRETASRRFGAFQVQSVRTGVHRRARVYADQCRAPATAS